MRPYEETLKLHPFSEIGMADNPKYPNRQSLRLQEYDYSQAGAYFVTLCTKDRRSLFGEIVDGVMQLNDAGKMIQSVWDEIPAHYSGIDVDEFVIMPNHFHGIVTIVGAGPRACPDFVQPTNFTSADECGQPQGVAPTKLSLPDVVHRFKTLTTKRYIDGVKQDGWRAFDGKLWHRNYWEHVVRNEHDLAEIREYIRNNPVKWEFDDFYLPP